MEPDRWYYWTDKLGILVWQDMPQAFGDNFTDAAKAQWRAELTREITTHRNHPSIVVWTLFNEGWGQHDTAEITGLARKLDPTRLLNSASGGYNQVVDGTMSRFRLPTPPGIGDINDTHTYPDPTTEKADPTRALACGEFGGISLRIPGHLWERDNFGYGTILHDGWRLTQRYQQLFREAYALAAGQHRAHVSDKRVVAHGHGHDLVVDPDVAGAFAHPGDIGLRVVEADVVEDGSSEQVVVLHDSGDVVAIAPQPDLRQRPAGELHLPLGWREDAQQQLHASGLAAS